MIGADNLILVDKSCVTTPLLSENFEDNFFNFKSLSLEQQEIIKMVFLLAQFVQKVCLDDNLSKYIALEFKNIISSIEEDLEFKKFYYKI